MVKMPVLHSLPARVALPPDSSSEYTSTLPLNGLWTTPKYSASLHLFLRHAHGHQRCIHAGRAVQLVFLLFVQSPITRAICFDFERNLCARSIELPVEWRLACGTFIFEAQVIFLQHCVQTPLYRAAVKGDMGRMIRNQLREERQLLVSQITSCFRVQMPLVPGAVFRFFEEVEKGSDPARGQIL